MSQNDHDAELRYVREEVHRFKQHLLTYLVVVGAVFLINFVTGGFWYGHFWFLWVAFIWGIVLAFQAIRLFGDDIGKDWESRMVDNIMARRRRGPPPSAPPPSGTPASPPPRA